MPKADKLAALMHEADIYLTQGLHQDAIALIKKFISDNAKIGADNISALEKSIKLIKSTQYSKWRNENELVTEVEISLLKKGWNHSATDDERLTSAGVLFDLGHYRHALEEYRRLLVKRCMNTAAFKGAALCLAHLHKPDNFATAVDRFAKEIFTDPNNCHALVVTFARLLGSNQYPRHFAALFNHLANISWDSDHRKF
jgi:tetratricopeptide (TPR) repeat protein